MRSTSCFLALLLSLFLVAATSEPTSEPEEIISALRDVLAAMSPMRQLTSQEKRNFRKDLFEILESTLNVEPYWLDRPARRMGTLYEESSEKEDSVTCKYKVGGLEIPLKPGDTTYDSEWCNSCYVGRAGENGDCGYMACTLKACDYTSERRCKVDGETRGVSEIWNKNGRRCNCWGCEAEKQSKVEKKNDIKTCKYEVRGLNVTLMVGSGTMDSGWCNRCSVIKVDENGNCIAACTRRSCKNKNWRTCKAYGKTRQITEIWNKDGKRCNCWGCEEKETTYLDMIKKFIISNK